MTRPAETVFVPSLDEMAHECVRRAVAGIPAPTLVDATAGNGYDAAFLASVLGSGALYAFDIQKKALLATRDRLTRAFPSLHTELVTPCVSGFPEPSSSCAALVAPCASGAQQAFSRCSLPRLRSQASGAPRAYLLLASHSGLASFVPPPIHAAMFNLGFLPGSDKAFSTAAASTLAALDALLTRMAKGGILSIHLYTGHPGGRQEADAVLELAASLPRDGWRVILVSQHNKLKNKEHLILAERRSG